jgi:hypothetical protein
VPAPGGWYRCKVTRVGPADDGKVYIWLQDEGNKFSNWFVAFEDMKREMLATALTALSMTLAVDANVESTDAYSRCMRLYVRRD